MKLQHQAVAAATAARRVAECAELLRHSVHTNDMLHSIIARRRNLDDANSDLQKAIKATEYPA